MRVYIVRHGQTFWNKLQLIQGHTDIPLNQDGINESKRFKEFLKEKGIVFDKCYSSDLIRAKDTAKLISDTEVITDSKLRERNFGIWEGKKKDEFIRNSNEKDYESDSSVRTRVFDFLKSLDSKEPILVVSHGGVIRSILNIDTTPKNMFDIKVKNTAYLELEFNDGKMELIETYGIILKNSSP